MFVLYLPVKGAHCISTLNVQVYIFYTVPVLYPMHTQKSHANWFAIKHGLKKICSTQLCFRHMEETASVVNEQTQLLKYKGRGQ